MDSGMEGGPAHVLESRRWTTCTNSTNMLDLPLSFLQRPAAPAISRPWLLVLLHGVGSNEQDLFALAPHIPDRFHVLSLRAPFRIGPDAYAWFDFSIGPDSERSIDAVQEAESRALAARSIEAAAGQWGIAPERVVVGGFSQGGMVCHGRLLPQVVPLTAPADALRGKQLWLSHGTHDDIIPLAHAQAVVQHMAPLPVTLSYREFPGAHEIRPAELTATVAWLESLTTGPAVR